MIIVDLDDFYKGPDLRATSLLFAIRKVIPKFKATLFTIPGRCTPAFLHFWTQVDWAQLVPHGWMHNTSRECEAWTYEESKAYLEKIEPMGLLRGFKAPGWQISDGMYQALLERGYWVADQMYNNERRPKELPVYLLDSPNKIHGHIGHLGGHNENELELIMSNILSQASEEFGFVRDNLCRPTTFASVTTG